MHRLSLALRGPGFLLLLLSAVLAGTALAHRGTTPRSRPSPLPILYFLSVNSGTGTLDRTTGLAARVSDARVASENAGNPRRLRILLRITFRNTSLRTQPVDPINFYGLADSGQTYGSDGRVVGVPGLRRSTMLPGGVSTGWIAFSVPARAERITVLWNDGNRLLPPASVASVGVQTASKK